jgi:hypothetical protein
MGVAPGLGPRVQDTLQRYRDMEELERAAVRCCALTRALQTHMLVQLAFMAIGEGRRKFACTHEGPIFSWGGWVIRSGSHFIRR